MKWSRVLLVLIGSISLSAGATPPADSPATVTDNLYQVAMKNPGFSPDIVKTYRPYLTPGLYASLWKAATKQAKVGEAGNIDFDVVLGGQDTPTKFEVGDTSTRKSEGSEVDVKVTLMWSTEKQHNTVRLTQIDGAWKVYDIDYGPDGDLSKMLK